MIQDLLSKEFVLELMETAKTVMAEDIKAKRVETGQRGMEGILGKTDAVTPEDLVEALSLMETTAQAEIKSSSGQPGFSPPKGKASGDLDDIDIDDSSYFARDAVISNAQTAFEMLFEERLPSWIVETGGRRDAPGGDGQEIPISTRKLKTRSLPLADSPGRRAGEQFSITDVRWVNSLIAMGVRWFRKKHAFNPEPAPPLEIGERARLLLVGDWGTGIPRAQKVAREMRRVMDEGNSQGIEQHVIHLGDVYYSGWKREYEKRFLPFWPVQPEEAESISSWSTNANHDMYAGGYGYYDVLLNDPRFQRQAKSSFFSLKNQNWTILGLDTAWDDHGLKDPQGAWVREMADSSNGKVMLLSHHQPFSAYENGKKNGGQKLREKLAPVLDSGRIHTWFWGHEHRCVLYKPHMGVQHGRCLGHGGVPVYMWRDDDDGYQAPAEYEYRARIQDGLESWALFGFAVLDFNGPRIDVRYIDENGTEHKKETIE